MRAGRRCARQPRWALDPEAAVVSVIVPHYNDLKALGICLASLQSQTLAPERFEIIVADNDSPQGASVVEQAIDGRARLTVVKERGAGPARNGGVKMARGDVLAFIDSDCVAEPEWLAEGLQALTRFDFIGGRVKVLVDDEKNMTGAEAFERVFGFDFKSYIERKGFTGSGNLFCSKKLFDAVGGFRLSVSEDVEWSNRARSLGFKLGYAAKAIVGHPARTNWAELRKKWVRINRETYNLYLESPGGRLWWFTRSLALPASAIVHTPVVLVSRELNSVSQRLAGIATLFRLRWWRLIDAMRLVSQPTAKD